MRNILDEKGAAMPLALAVMFVVSLLAAALWQYSMTETLQVERKKKELQAHYLARGGANATIAAWLEAPFNNKPDTSNDVDGKDLYVKNDGTFTVDDPGIEEKFGEVNVSVVPDEEEDGITHIKAKGTVGGVDSSITASSAPYVDGADLEEIVGQPNLYDKSTSLIAPGPDISHITVNGISKTLNSHEPVDGAVKFDTDSQTPLHIQNNTCVGITARAMEFDSPLDLEQGHDRDVGALFLNAEYISFANSVIVDDYNYWTGWFWPVYHYYYGTIILNVPDGYGVDGEDIGGQAGCKYGMVFFGDAEIWKSNWFIFFFRDNVDLAMANKAYYFKQRTDGIDLVKWHNGDYTEGVDYIGIENPGMTSMPRGSGLFYWSKD